MKRSLRALLSVGALLAVGLPVTATAEAAAGMAMAAGDTALLARCRVVAAKPALTSTKRIRVVGARSGCSNKALTRVRLKKVVPGPDRVVKSGARVVRNARLTLTVPCASGVFYTTVTDARGRTAVSGKVRVTCPTRPKPSPSPTPGGGGGGSSSGVGSAVENEVVRLTNAERAKAGCGPLTHDARLHKAALGHSADMSAKNYFSHDSQDGRDFSDRIKAAGYSFTAIGENIAQGQRSAASVVNDWMNSPGHRQNILNCNYVHIGVGYVAAGGPYWTQDFGKP
ncbi:CAP domain-containing protein [Acrocarpospora catenulata]|uniref:CAP domain-containing protein n=1 Tax=Acrocarpospora catenulata TaxID=2836182 RepID=UPI0020239BE9|nr:CAP domain-containing protein [Acrocarpospora catenulata]